MKDYVSPDWAVVLAFNGFDSFEALWNVDTEWFEPPNRRRGGWSGVVRLSLALPGGGRVGAFLKRQENHVHKSLLHPFRGVPTFVREFRNLRRFRDRGIPSLEPLYFGFRSQGGDMRAILLTKELEGYEPLDTLGYSSHGDKISRKPERDRLFYRVAEVMRKMHRHRFQHNCLYLKHIFVKKAGADFDVRILDLEKVKWRPSRRHAICRDLYTLACHSGGWRSTDKLRFFKMYMQQTRLETSGKTMWRAIADRMVRKGREISGAGANSRIDEKIP